jgi:hypothetical protein
MNKRLANIKIGKKLSYLVAGNIVTVTILVGVAWWSTVALQTANAAGELEDQKSELAQRISVNRACSEPVRTADAETVQA